MYRSWKKVLWGWWITLKNSSLLSKNGGIRFTAETRRSLREISSAPIGRRQLDQKLLPFDHKTGTLWKLCKLFKALSWSNRSLFIWRSFTAKQKIGFSASSAALRWENFVHCSSFGVPAKKDCLFSWWMHIIYNSYWAIVFSYWFCIRKKHFQNPYQKHSVTFRWAGI